MKDLLRGKMYEERKRLLKIARWNGAIGSDKQQNQPAEQQNVTMY